MPASPDAVVVGAGIVGAAVAYELAKRGATVHLVDRGPVGREASWAAAGVLTPVHLAEYPGALSQLCAAAPASFPGLVEELKSRSGIDVELRRSGMLLLIRDEDDAHAAALLQDWKRERGHPFERLTGEQARAREGAIAADIAEALLLPDVLQVRNHRLTRALAEAAESLGAAISRDREVTGFLKVPGRVNGVKTTRGDILAGTTVIAAGAWAGALMADIGVDLPVRPVRGQILLLEGPPGRLKHLLLHKDQYAVPRDDGRILVGSTVEEAGFDNRVTAEGAAFLLGRLAEFAPGMLGLTLAGSWSGLRPATPDRLPYLGKVEGLDGVVLACGLYRNGILLAPLVAGIVADLAGGREPAFDVSAFRPGRAAAAG